MVVWRVQTLACIRMSFDSKVEIPQDISKYTRIPALRLQVLKLERLYM